MRALLLLALLLGCSTYDASLLPVCLWTEVRTTTQPTSEQPAGFDCYTVTAPSGHSRVSPVELPVCDAETLGLGAVTVQKGERVWMYSEPSLVGAGEFRTKWARCGE